MVPEENIDRFDAQAAAYSPRFEAPHTVLYRPKPRRLWLHVLLLLATLFTTTLVGAHMQLEFNFSHALPFLHEESILEYLGAVFAFGMQSVSCFAMGLPFSLTLLTILMAHEMGHYLACVCYGIDATLPFFLPSPVPITGTFGAFIRINSPIFRKKPLFDVGIAGPLAGFVFLVPALLVGLAFSKISPVPNHQESIQLGVPALQWLAEKLIFPGIPTSRIYLHPVARAAGVGMLATALNLLPIGQLDGGHVLYTLVGRRQVWVTNFFLGALVPLGIVWPVWRQLWLMGVLVFFLARKHPPVYDNAPLGAARIRLSFLALCIFILCLSVPRVSD